jgi:serine-type D-Ala-D-Ala carboxypeptidase/endopeptidase (penicillin-binding protein 4)
VSQPPPSSRRANRDAAKAKPAARKQAKPATPVVAAAPGTPATPGAPGVGPFAKHPRAWIAAAIGVAFLLLGTGAVFAGAAYGSGDGPADIGPSSTADAARSVPVEMPAASRLRTCSVAGLAEDPRLASFSGAVVNANTGELLFDRGASTGVTQGAVVQVLTAAAALNILGPDYTLSTRVYEGSSPGTIVLVGGGDSTLSRLPAGQESVYQGAAKLASLAAEVKAAYSGTVTNIVLDATAWSSGDKWDATWSRAEQTGGNLSEVTALQVDGDRDDPTQQKSARSTDPVARAGEWFAEALDDAGVDIDLDAVTFSLGAAVTTKPLLGEVTSQPISVLINQMLVAGDATLAETLARVISKGMSLGGTASSINQAITSAVAVYEVDTTGVTVHDGSGTSGANAVPPAFMAKFMVKVAQGAANLNLVYDSLAVAGKSGSLANRFTGDNAVAKGAVIGKTGASGGVYSLAGTIAAADGSQLAFAFYAVEARDTSRAAIDSLVAGAYNCGDNLSNN